MALDASKKRDIGWNYGTQGLTKDSVNCNFCGSTFNGGITRHKQHLVGGYKNVKQCSACPSVIREEVRAYMQNKIANNPKFQVRQPEEYVDIDDMDEYAEMMPPSKTPKISSSGGGFEKGGGIDETKKILRERAFIEKIGQHGPGMKPPTFHEVRVRARLAMRYGIVIWNHDMVS
ncbi:hypothetical protein KY289_001268 [Solanum tuberosum]|nr:hypothetical protein KY289_001268 [Solanum tuberosum]